MHLPLWCCCCCCCSPVVVADIAAAVAPAIAEHVVVLSLVAVVVIVVTDTDVDANAAVAVDVADVEKSCGVKRLLSLEAFVTFVVLLLLLLILIVMALLFVLLLKSTRWSEAQTDPDAVVDIVPVADVVVSYELFVLTTLQSSDGFSQSIIKEYILRRSSKFYNNTAV